MNLISNRDGFALPLVLGITTMLTIIIVTISASVSRKIAIVTEFKDRCQADLKTYSAMNETLYTLLTATFTFTGLKLPPPDQGTEPVPFVSSDPPVPFWNLYGKPIALANGARVVLRDTAGMLSPVAYNSKLFRRLLEQAQPDAANFLDVLADWQDRDELKRLHGAERWEYRQADLPCAPRNAPIGSISELRLLQGFDAAIFERIKADLIYWPASTNYLTMSSNMLQAFIDDKAIVDQLLSLRRDGRLTPALFASLTGIRQSEDVPLVPSGRVKVTVTATVKKAHSRIEAVVSKRETTDHPYTIYMWRR